MTHIPGASRLSKSSSAHSTASPFLSHYSAMQSYLQDPNNSVDVCRSQGDAAGISASCARAQVAYSRKTRRGLHLELEPAGADMVLVELHGLLSERYYTTTRPEQPYVRANRAGRGLLRVAVHGRTCILLEPVA